MLSDRKTRVYTRGIIQLSNIPEGTAEAQLRRWFSQFGDVTRVVVYRSTKTGNKTGRAYVELASSAVAKVVTSKLPSYMLFGKVVRLTLVEATADSANRILNCRNARVKSVDQVSRVTEIIKRRTTIQVPEGTDPSKISKYTEDKGRATLKAAGINLKFDRLSDL